MDGAERCEIQITYESRLIDLNRAREWRYTHESQQQISPGDLGFEYVAGLQEREIRWGMGQSRAGQAAVNARQYDAANDFSGTGSIFVSRKQVDEARAKADAEFYATRDYGSDR
jgi:hypothetical protein